MKKIFKYSLLLLAAGLVFTACKDDDSAGKLDPVVLSGPQVYFSTELSSVVELSKEKSSFSVPVNRQNAQGEITVAIKTTMPDDSPYNVPANITFADGASVADLIITYNPDDLEFGNYTEMTLDIAEESQTTPYGLTSYTFSAGVTEFEDWDIALYREALVSDLFGTENLIYEVPIQRSVIREGVYRLVNPYGEPYPYNAPGDYNPNIDSYMVIDASDPEYVYVEPFETTMDWSYGFFFGTSMAGYYIAKGKPLETVKAANPEYFGTLENGIISMPPASFACGLSKYNNGNYMTGLNATGLFAVALPGYRFADYSVEYTYRGSLRAPDGQDYVVGTATFGSDVASARAALATAETLQDVYVELLSGGGLRIEDGIEFELPFDASGKYYVLIVTFDDEEEAHDYAMPSVNVMTVKDQTGQQVVWSAEYVGDYTYGLFKSDNVDEGLTLYVEEGANNHFKIEPWGVGKSLELYVDEEGVITVPEDQPSGITGAKGELLCTDYMTYTGGDTQYVSKLEGAVFTIFMVYYNEGGEEYLVKDTFEITGDAEVKKAVKVSSKRLAKERRVSLFNKKFLKVKDQKILLK